MSTELRNAELVAQRQYGLITRDQALSAGLSERQIDYRISKRLWVTVCPRVYRLISARSCFELDAMAACLWGGPGTVLSHQTAARIWNLDRFRQEPSIHLLAPPRLSRGPGHVQLHRTTNLHADEVTLLQNFRVTTLQRTLFDLGTELNRFELGRAVDAARRRDHLILQRVLPMLERRRTESHKGTRILESVISKRLQHSGTDSTLEDDTLARIEDYGLPLPVTQAILADGDVYIVRGDLLWPWAQVVLHVDGPWHGDLAQRDRDARQRSRLSRLNVRQFWVTPGTLEEDGWLEDLRIALSVMRQPELFSA